jgi:ribosomal protein S18 acetylase RimI-like enzyme
MHIRIKEFNEKMMTITRDQFISTYMTLFNDKQNLKLLSFTGKPFIESAVRNWVKKKSDSINYYIALDERDIIAGIMVLKKNTIEGIELFGLVVDSRYRKKGIGRQFLATAEKYAESLEYKSIQVSVFADNIEMIVLLIKNLYKPVGISYNKRYDNEDILEFKKTLSQT